MSTQTATPQTENVEQLRYPVGRFKAPETITREHRADWIRQIEQLSTRLSGAVEGLSDPQLDTPYRPGGWTVRQVVHHLADSHMNSVIRFRFGLTEDEPLIKPYNEADWAKLPDAKTGPLRFSLPLLESLHERWAMLLHSMSDGQFARTIRHPEWGLIRLDWTLGLYAWHCRHHVAHILGLRERNGW